MTAEQPAAPPAVPPVAAGPLAWGPLTERDLPEVAALAARVLAVDGGLPLIAQLPFLSRRYAGDGVSALGARDHAGTLVAAGAVRPESGGRVATGMVDPAARGRGVGAALLDWTLATAADGACGSAVTVQTESLTGPAADLFDSRGLRRVFAEDVMRLDLTGAPPRVALPAGVHLETWTPATAGRFFAVYAAAFAQRPGFPGWPARRWIDWVAQDDGFRPGWSLLAVDPAAGDVAFIACAEGWIVQVGVRPDQRGRRLGIGLVTEALSRMLADGRSAVLLDVNVNNPTAIDLYERLGFARIGRRATYAR